MRCQPGGGGCHSLCHTLSLVIHVLFFHVSLFHDACHEEVALQSRDCSISTGLTSSMDSFTGKDFLFLNS